MKYFFYICFFFGLIFLFRPIVHGIDPAGYYSWVRSIVIDGDFNLENEFDHYRDQNEVFDHASVSKVKTPTGYQYNQWSAGWAILWIPFFPTAHLFVLIASSLGFAVSGDGYGTVYTLAVGLGSAIYAYIGLLLNYKIARN